MSGLELASWILICSMSAGLDVQRAPSRTGRGPVSLLPAICRGGRVSHCPYDDRYADYLLGLPGPSPDLSSPIPITIRVSVHYLIPRSEWDPDRAHHAAQMAIRGLSRRLAGEGGDVQHQLTLRSDPAHPARSPEYMNTLHRGRWIDLTLESWTHHPLSTTPRKTPHPLAELRALTPIRHDLPPAIQIWVGHWRPTGTRGVSSLPLQTHDPLHGIYCDLDSLIAAGSRRGDGVLDHHLGHYLGLPHLSEEDHPTNFMTKEENQCTWLTDQVVQMYSNLWEYYPEIIVPELSG